MICEILGNRYELQEKIGEGGMSTVYKARCNKLNRYVAVKILKKELAENEEVVKKFKIEATAIATLSDNNIVNVLDVGTQGDINYIVMEYVKGKTLKDVINQFGKLNYETAISMATQIAKALECAHKNSIIHRDVKPQNILVTEDGLVKVTDFGIAKSSSSSTLTNTTTIMGSAHYFSPEQAKGSVVDARTDIYSLGVVLYEMVTGKLPFEAESPVTIALKHIQEEVVPPKQVNSKVPESLNNLILKTMDKDPNNRYQDARELIVDLQKIKEDPNVIIGNKKSTPLDEGHTIIMSPVTDADIAKAAEVNKVQASKENEDEYGEDEYYDDEYYDDEYDDLKKKKGVKKTIIIVLSVIAALIAMFLIAYALAGGNKTTDTAKEIKVPEIVGMTLEQAKVALEREGLVLVEAGTEKSSEAKGTVLEADPKEGTEVASGSNVRVMVSSGADKVTMPDFKESELATVKTFLTKNGVSFTTSDEYSDTISEGAVIRTEPGVGTEVTKDTKVTIYISLGKKIKSVEVKNYQGLAYEDAKAKLEKAGLEVKRGDDKTTEDQSLNGKVATQSNVNETVNEGSAITLTVWKYVAPEKKSIEVGSIDLFKGMTLDGARSAIKSAASWLTINTSGKGSFVIDWSPKGKIEEGGSITLSLQENDPNVAATTTPTK